MVHETLPIKKKYVVVSNDMGEYGTKTGYRRNTLHMN